MNTGIVVPCHNAPDYTKNLLADLEATTPATVPVVVVDDASDPSLAAWLRDFAYDTRLWCHYLRNENQQLFTRTVNRGHRYICNSLGPSSKNIEVLVTINSDCRLEPGWLQALIDPFTHSNLRAGIVGYPEEFRVGKKQKELALSNHPEYITGHCWGVRVEVLRQVGVLCETDTDGSTDSSLANVKGQAHIGSERWLCWRANQVGWNSYYVNKPLVKHVAAGASWGRKLSWLANFDLQPIWPASDSLDYPTEHELARI